MLSNSLHFETCKQKACAIFETLTAVLMIFEVFWVLVNVKFSEDRTVFFFRVEQFKEIQLLDP
jgi:hypothetical protein